MNPPMPTLETPRLRLRPLRRADAPRIQQLFPHPEMLKYMTTAIPWPYPDDGAERFLDLTLPKDATGEQYDWAITLKAADDDRLIGLISLYPSGTDHRGFWLAPDYHRQGLMTEAVCAVNDFAFSTLGMPHLILGNAEPNVASHRLKEKSGARIVAVEDDFPYICGRFRRIVWRLTREDWERHRASFCA